MAVCGHTLRSRVLHLCNLEWVSYTYLVDKEESTRIEADLTTLSKGIIADSTWNSAVESLRTYTNDLRAKTRQAEKV